MNGGRDVFAKQQQTRGSLAKQLTEVNQLFDRPSFVALAENYQNSPAFLFLPP